MAMGAPGTGPWVAGAPLRSRGSCPASSLGMPSTPAGAPPLPPATTSFMRVQSLPCSRALVIVKGWLGYEGARPAAQRTTFQNRNGPNFSAVFKETTGGEFREGFYKASIRYIDRLYIRLL